MSKREVRFFIVFILILVIARIEGIVKEPIESITYIISDLTLLGCYINIKERPIISVIMLFISRLILIIVDIDMVTTSILLFIALIIHSFVAFRKQKNILKYKRQIINIPFWSRWIIWTTILSCIIGLSSNISYLYDSREMAVYASMVIVIQTVNILAIMSTTSLVIDTIIVEELLSLYTVYRLFIIDELTIYYTALVVIKLVVIIYSMKGDNSNERFKERQNNV